MSLSKTNEFQTTLELLSARRQYLIEHRRLSETWELELDALTMAIKSLQKWLQEYATSPTPQVIDEFISMHQFGLRLENRYTSIQF
jgi:hypothetical protein